ncbi:MAG: prenyltransferase/squalene oxidase repeat-containing protein [Candidatus Nanopelagicales bacterium]|jgi:squalene-hopene/tetraprenyl-beta-curcumene cyclase
MNEQRHLALRTAAGKMRRSHRDSRWRAFHLYPGISDEWVAAYVACAMLEAHTAGLPGTADAEELAMVTWESLLSAQRSDGRWGFNGLAIGDGDSTLWAMRLARALGRDPGPAASRVIRQHQRPNGSLSTYAADEPIRTIIEADPSLSFDGWVGAHSCVTAVGTVVAEVGKGARQYLVDSQGSDGGWRAYWWRADAYVAAFAVEGLAESHSQSAVRAAGWAIGMLQSDGAAHIEGQPSAFATACVARAAAWSPDDDHRDGARRALDWLDGHVDLRGGWPASAHLRVPNPDDEEPWASGREWLHGGRKERAVVLDADGIFTTATALSAYARAAAW